MTTVPTRKEQQIPEIAAALVATATWLDEVADEAANREEFKIRAHLLRRGAALLRAPAGVDREAVLHLVSEELIGALEIQRVSLKNLARAIRALPEAKP